MFDAPKPADAIGGEDLRARPAAEKRSIDELSPAIRVFVHLAQQGRARLAEARQSGTLVGVNDETPYGYGRARRMGCDIAFSHSEPEIAASKFIRLAFRALLGFDLIHALRQRQSICQADIVWTHTDPNTSRLQLRFCLRACERDCSGRRFGSWTDGRVSVWRAARFIAV